MENTIDNKIVIYQTPDGNTNIDVRLENETVWLTANQMAFLFENQPLLSNDETNALFDVVVDYTYALNTLDSYDYQRLTVSDTTDEAPFHATYDNAMQAILSLKERFGESALFGNEKDDSFKSSIGQIYQTFDGIELYPRTEEKAAMLLYLVSKNHSFSDGNKRIAATLFLCFLNNNHIDLQTGADIDLLSQPTYTFTQSANSTFAEGARFLIKLSSEAQASLESGNSQFAYVNGDNIGYKNKRIKLKLNIL